MFLYIDLVGSADCQRLRDALIFALTFSKWQSEEDDRGLEPGKAGGGSLKGMGSGKNGGKLSNNAWDVAIDERVEGRIAYEQALLGSLAAGWREICGRRGCLQAKWQEDKKKRAGSGNARYGGGLVVLIPLSPPHPSLPKCLKHDPCTYAVSQGLGKSCQKHSIQV